MKRPSEQEAFKKDIQRAGEENLDKIRKAGVKGIVLAGRPYHIDPQINHGIPEMINSLVWLCSPRTLWLILARLKGL